MGLWGWIAQRVCGRMAVAGSGHTGVTPAHMQAGEERSVCTRVESTEDRLTCWSEREGKACNRRSFAWSALQRVSIVTTDDGPLEEDVFWVLHHEGGTCVVASRAQGVEPMRKRLLSLPGFDQQAFIRSASSSTNAVFLCWSRQE